MPESKTSELKVLWLEFTEKISETLPEQSFRTWIQPIRPESLDDNTLTLYVPSQFHYEWVDSHYSQKIRGVFGQLIGREIRLSFKVDSTDGDHPDHHVPAPQSKQRSNTRRSPKPQDVQLNSRYAFDNFVEGDGNSFARAACLAIAEAPGKTPWNPLLIYGGTGLGKTHLLQAIGNHVLKEKKVSRVKYVSSERYTQEFIHSVKNNCSTDFSKLYRSAEFLLVDDVQFFSSKGRTQIEFFHTFNSLYQAGKQIILSCDRPVHELKDIDERLISRFQSGLITQISPPDFETRVAILERRADEEGVALPLDIAQFFATHIKNNIRELEGALVTLIARATFYRLEPNLELAGQVLQEKMGRPVGKPQIEQIQEVVAKHFQLSGDALRGKSRKKEIALARMMAMSLATKLTDHSLKHIGQLFGGRDHSTVIHARNTIHKLIEKDALMRDTYESLRHKLSLSTLPSTKM